MDWPAKSPDRKPMENVWGSIVRDVYAAFRQLDNVDNLRDALLHEWKRLDRVYLQNLVKPMQKRCADLILKNGGPTY